MTPDPRITFGLSCPTGGEFRICQNTSTRFIGCCSVDPCTPTRGGQCPETELFEASFSASAGVNLVPQGCATSGTWYTCPDARPPFLGCCTRDPCDKGCGTDHLVPATLSDNDVYASQLMIPEPDSDGNGGARTWMIVGVTAVGVLVFLLVFIGLSLWMKRRDRKTETRRGRTTGMDANLNSMLLA
ncbi:hypothetical protein GGS21DRAFT_505516 [Xylaria nigripes]|nr:hypothetical protein GGS21DRAFT_505516 [Xylaria nigripes]